jgi:hypothetical protein
MSNMKPTEARQGLFFAICDAKLHENLEFLYP